ncbi:hypothetical protein GALMADRAFT_213018 [Galerina marginata CBS 339.88]|uniref:Uncharacterized protein n=1 Tax=Galerina marginata (strain CBS 339.88) TaxID=685588 RepID=A0A067SQ55_GALM3|nr:hypothetical protein GALMADRAFT_213018 [Galerina marginata CBS 339.88]
MAIVHRNIETRKQRATTTDMAQRTYSGPVPHKLCHCPWHIKVGEVFPWVARLPASSPRIPAFFAAPIFMEKIIGLRSCLRSPSPDGQKRFKLMSKKSLAQLRAHVAPTLQTLEFTDHDHFITDLATLPFAAAKKVAFVRWSLTFEECFYILSNCSSATEVFLEASNNTTPSLPPGPVQGIRLNNLTSLELSSVVHPMELLRRLTLPKLESLKIVDGVGGYWYNKSPEMPVQIIENFLSRSKCPLRLLFVEDFTITMEEVVRFLKIPAVREIRTVEFKCAHVLERMEKLLISCGEGERVLRGVRKDVVTAGDAERLRRKKMLDGVDFKVWQKVVRCMNGTGDDEEEIEQDGAWGQFVGSKALREDEELLMEYRGGRICSGWDFIIMP